MRNSSLYRLLESPIIYTFVQELFAPGYRLFMKKKYKNIFSESTGLILDVGCGPRLTTPPPKKGTIVGVDINAQYVEKYTGEGVDTDKQLIKDYCGSRSYFGFVCSADNLLFDDNTFDETRCSGLLHHLPNESALQAIKEMLRCTRPLGKVIIFDNVWPKNPICRPLAWFTRRYDRGQWVRTESELLDIANMAYGGNWKYSRFTYTLSGLEGIFLTVRKPSVPV